MWRCWDGSENSIRSPPSTHPPQALTSWGGDVAERTVRGIAADNRILAALEDGPLSAREIADKLHREVLDAWAERHGYDFEWGTSEEPFGARLLAISEAAETGLPHLYRHTVDPRLRGLERRGEVERIQLPGHRPMLWRLAGRTPKDD